MSQNRIPPEAQDALSAGRKIEAIKITRAQTGLDLKEAKEAVESFLEQNPSANQRFRVSAAEQRQRSRPIIKLLILIGLGVLVYLWLSGNGPQ
jgi:hypothetical protein